MRVFGIVMIALGLLVGVFVGLATKHELEHSTAVTVGTVVGEKLVKDDGGKTVRKVQISYTLPDGTWLVLKESDLEVGAEVNVHYNPDDPTEKVIEGFEESPFGYVLIGLFAAALGAAAVAASALLKKSDNANDVLDLVDRPVG